MLLTFFLRVLVLLALDGLVSTGSLSLHVWGSGAEVRVQY